MLLLNLFFFYYQCNYYCKVVQHIVRKIQIIYLSIYLSPSHTAYVQRVGSYAFSPSLSHIRRLVAHSLPLGILVFTLSLAPLSTYSAATRSLSLSLTHLYTDVNAARRLLVYFPTLFLPCSFSLSHAQLLFSPSLSYLASRGRSSSVHCCRGVSLSLILCAHVCATRHRFCRTFASPGCLVSVAQLLLVSGVVLCPCVRVSVLVSCHSVSVVVM